MIFLVVRYAISSEAELALLVGEGKTRETQSAYQAVEDHLVDASLDLLRLRVTN